MIVSNPRLSNQLKKSLYGETAPKCDLFFGGFFFGGRGFGRGGSVT
jgi:hypothetical protein